MAEFETLRALVIEGNGTRASGETQSLIDAGESARSILDNALLPGMEVVGERMRSGDCFIPEVLLSARTMQECLDIIKPLLGATESASVATVVIGTVEGDLHDIGKNLVGMLLQGAGFEIVNLGTGVTAAEFVAAAREHSAQIVGMSALLTTTLPRMVETIAALEDAGLRGTVKVIVGGAPVTQAYAEEIGADAYGANAALGVEACRDLVASTATATEGR
jgi:methylmalonyl-CoA mutase cobalamin-binding domain/chain